MPVVPVAVLVGPTSHVLCGVHTLFCVAEGARVWYWLDVQVVYAVHTLFCVAEGARVWYWPDAHAVCGLQAAQARYTAW